MRRLDCLKCMIQGVLDCIQRLKTETFADFTSISKQLIALAAEIEKIRLRDGPNHMSNDQVLLAAQLKRTQKLYLFHHHRNEWAVVTVRNEVEFIINQRLWELQNVLREFDNSQ